MSARPNPPPMPAQPFGLLLVEGGDEEAVCKAVAGPATWAGLCAWNAQGRLGAIETLCRRAVRNAALAACVDQLVTCAGTPHALQARADKGWLRAYLGMTADPNARFYHVFDASDGIDPAHPAFDPLRAFLRAL